MAHKLRPVTRTPGNNQALKDGAVTPAGFEFAFDEVPVLVHAFRQMVLDLEFDVWEMALMTYLTARERGAGFTALPIFLVRGFHHGAIRYHRSGITKPTDFDGRRVAVNHGCVSRMSSRRPPWTGGAEECISPSHPTTMESG